MEGLIDMSAKTVIKEIIKAKNISQAELAEATNTTRQKLSNKMTIRKRKIKAKYDRRREKGCTEEIRGNQSKKCKEADPIKEVCPMLAAVKGIVQGNTVVIEDEDIRDYDGAEVVVTLLNYPQRKAKKAPVDWDSFAIPSERGQHVDEYMREMRENDRL